MNVDFQEVPEFFTGQPIAAEDINNFYHNNVVATNLLYAPQPLFMSSHAYSPTALPTSWRSPDFDIWRGSFMYRDGMQKAYLGFHIRLDWSTQDLNHEYTPAQFSDVSIAVIVKYTDQNYKNLYSSNNKKFCAAAKLSQLGQTTVTNTGGSYTFNIKNGHFNNSDVENILGTTVITRDSKMSTLEINLAPLGLVDGEIVDIKLVIVSNNDPTQPARLGDGYTTLFNKFFYKSKLTGAQVATSHIFYSMMYAKVDGDLSYSADFPYGTPFNTAGNSVLSQENIDILTTKQKYITERLRNRPMPLTGSIVYVSAWGGTASVRLLEKDVVPGDWNYYTSNYWTPIDNSGTKLTESSDLPKVLDINRSLNTQSNLATFAWSPYFTLYNSLYLNFRFYGNTQARQALFLDMPDQPSSQTSTRRSIIYWPSPRGRLSHHVTGNWQGQDIYGSIFAYHSTIPSVYNSNSLKVYLNRLYNVRIPSPTTPVYSPEFGQNSLQHSAPYSNFYLTQGLWEDSVRIVFTKTAESGIFEKWGLAKAEVDQETIQYGFVSDSPVQDAVGTYQNKIIVSSAQTERDIQYLRSSFYNDSNYQWTFKNKSKGYSPIFVNLYDHHSRNLQQKANYISYCQVIGMTTTNPDRRLYDAPTKVEPTTSLTYSQLVGHLSTINQELDNLYTNMFTLNPFFTKYDMFWNRPLSMLNNAGIYKEYNEKFFFFTRQRTGNILIVRGKNVSIHYGDIEELKRDEGPKGSLHPPESVSIKYAKTQSIISGDSEQTVVFHLETIEDLPYGQYYYLQGESVVYAAEFFEEPS